MIARTWKLPRIALTMLASFVLMVGLLCTSALWGPSRVYAEIPDAGRPAPNGEGASGTSLTAAPMTQGDGLTTQSIPALENVRLEGTVLKWDAYPNTKKYRITNGGSITIGTSSTEYDLANMHINAEERTYEVYVTAYSSTNIVIAESKEPIVYNHVSPYNRAPAPENLSWNGTKATWRAYADTLKAAIGEKAYEASKYSLQVKMNLYEATSSGKKSLALVEIHPYQFSSMSEHDWASYILHADNDYSFTMYVYTDALGMKSAGIEPLTRSVVVESVAVKGKDLIAGARPIEGAASLDAAVLYAGTCVTCQLSGDIATIDANKVGYSWMCGASSSDGECVASGYGPAYSAYVTQLADAGKLLYCTVSAEGFFGVIKSPPVMVKKTPMWNTPVEPDARYEYGRLVIHNPEPTQEYIVRTTSSPAPTEASDWAKARSSKEPSLDVTSLATDNAINYVYTRFKETDAYEAGTVMPYTAVYLGASSDVKGLELSVFKETGNGHVGYRVGDVLKVKADCVPANASSFTGVSKADWTCGWSHAVSFLNDETNEWGTFYTTPECTDTIESGITTAYGTNLHPYVYVKLKKAGNDVPIMAKYGSYYAMKEIDVAEADGTCIPKDVALPTKSANVAVGTGVSISFDYSPTGSEDYIRNMYGSAGDASTSGRAPTITFRPESKIMLIDASHAEEGLYTYRFYDGNGEKISSMGAFDVAVHGYVPLEGVSFTQDSYALSQGSTTSTHVNALPEGAVVTNVVWTSSDESAVTVRGYGTGNLFAYIHVLEDATPGQTVTITAQPSSTPPVTCTVTVLEVPKTCTYCFDANGGTGQMDPLVVKQGATFTLPECTFTPPVDKEFYRWDCGAVGDTMVAESSLLVSAEWKDTAVPSVAVPSVAIKKLVAARRGFKVVWKPKEAVTGYKIQYSLTKKFKKAKTMTKTVKNAKKQQIAVKNLKSNKKYYVRIRAYKKVDGKMYCGKWSKVKTVTTG